VSEVLGSIDEMMRSRAASRHRLRKWGKR